MKNTILKMPLLGLLALSLILTSCGSFRDQFSHQRYTGFKVKHHENVTTADVHTVSAPVNVEKNEVVIPTSNSVKNTPVKMDVPSTQNMHSAPEVKEESNGFVKKKGVIHPVIMKKSALIAPVEKNNMPQNNAALLVILCILLPWAAVLIEKGVGSQFWLDLILWFLFILPGIIYAFIVCFG